MTQINRDELGEWLSAYLDGELDDRHAQEVTRWIESDDEARALYESLRETSRGLAALPRHAAPDSIVDNVRYQLERHELLGDEAGADVSTGSPTGSVFSKWVLAAVLGFAAVGAIWTIADRSARQRGTPVAVNETSPGAYGDPSKAMPADRRASNEKSRPSIADDDTARALASRSPASPLPPIPTEAQENAYTGILNFDQKLAADMPRDTLLAHNFANEKRRLSVTFRSPNSSRQAAESLETWLRKEGVDDLESSSGKPIGQALVLRGREGRNFTERHANQLLLRVPAPAVERVYARVRDLMQSDSEVSLELDAFRVSGDDRVATTLHALTAQHDTTVASAQPSAAGSAAPTESTEENLPPHVAWTVFEDLISSFRATPETTGADRIASADQDAAMSIDNGPDTQTDADAEPQATTPDANPDPDAVADARRSLVDKRLEAVRRRSRTAKPAPATANAGQKVDTGTANTGKAEADEADTGNAHEDRTDAPAQSPAEDRVATESRTDGPTSKGRRRPETSQAEGENPGTFASAAQQPTDRNSLIGEVSGDAATAWVTIVVSFDVPPTRGNRDRETDGNPNHAKPINAPPAEKPESKPGANRANSDQ